MMVFVAGSFALFWNSLNLQSLAKQEAALLDYRDENPVAVFVLAFLIYVAMAAVSFPGAAVMTVAYGAYFGFWQALILVSFASTLGALLAFLSSRYLLRRWLQRRFGERWSRFESKFEQEGAFYLFSLRLIVAIPFALINLMMGLTSIRVRTYWWVSQLGMLPATAIYVYFGDSLPGFKKLAEQGVRGILNWQWMLGLALIGLAPLIFRQVISWLQRQRKNRDKNLQPEALANSVRPGGSPTDRNTNHGRD